MTKPDIRAVVNCHPNEAVGKDFGVAVAEEIRKRGREVETIPMPDQVDMGDGRALSCWEAFTDLSGLLARNREEEAIARACSDILTVTFHDSPYILHGYPAQVSRVGNPSNLLIFEIAIPRVESKDPERIALAERVRQNFSGDHEWYSKYVTHDSDLSSNRAWLALRPDFVRRVADLLEKEIEYPFSIVNGQLIE